MTDAAGNHRVEFTAQGISLEESQGDQWIRKSLAQYGPQGAREVESWLRFAAQPTKETQLNEWAAPQSSSALEIHSRPAQMA